MNRRTAALALATLCAWAGLPAQAQPNDYPNRPIRIIVPFTPGSGSDSSARYFGERIGKQLGQGVVVENRPGANGIIALQAVKNAPPDGYTVLLATNSPMAVNPLVFKNLSYDPARDFKPVSGLSRGMNTVIVSNESPFKTLDDLLAAAKNKSLMMGTYSAGYELVGQWLADVSGGKFTNVPYKGQAPIMTDVIGNQLDFAVVDLSGAMELVRSGKLRALAVTGEERNPDIPEVPTVREKGFPEFRQYSWTSFYVHAQTPDAFTMKLADAVGKALASDDARAYVRRNGSELMPYPPQQMQQFHLAEIERFRRIADKIGMKPQ